MRRSVRAGIFGAVGTDEKNDCRGGGRLVAASVEEPGRFLPSRT